MPSSPQGFFCLTRGINPGRHAAAGSDAAAGGGALKAERGLRAAVRSFGADLAAVLRHPVFACAVAGITFYTGAAAGPRAPAARRTLGQDSRLGARRSWHCDGGAR